ncbi:MAG: response regulator [SAR324 cluster bacterium]|nr:response regulator [SAR324 cluster bacterium]
MPINILVVDDEIDLEFLILQKLRKKIDSEEFQFTFARNGIEALEKLSHGLKADLVLTDINMPKMDGLVLLAKLNEQYPILRTVVISAYSDMDNIRKAMNLGAFDFLTKPLNFQDMEITINKTYLRVKQLKDNIDGRLRAEENWRREEAARESLEELNKLKNEFIGFMTHELRTPLNTVLANVSFLEIAMDDPSFLEEEGLAQIDLVKRIRTGAEVLLQLVKSSLDLRKMESGKIHLDFQFCNMAELIEDVVNNCVMLAKQKKLELKFKNSVFHECLAVCDRNYFLQVLRNLIGNAIQYTKEGEIIVFLEEDGEQVIIAIRDTGCGIPSKYIGKIFNQFEQIHRKEQEQQGAGLGLAYCQEMIKLHNGSISVESEEDRGSTFTVRIPKQQPDNYRI